LKSEEEVFNGDVAVDGKVLGGNPAMEDGLWSGHQRKGWESSEKRRETVETVGRKTPASIQGQRVNLGKTAFQVTAESWHQTYKLQEFEQREGWDLR
jgi:hypothetical protein